MTTDINDAEEVRNDVKDLRGELDITGQKVHSVEQRVTDTERSLSQELNHVRGELVRIERLVMEVESESRERESDASLQDPQIDVHLSRTENAWKPIHKSSESMGQDEEIFRKIKGILNKLTPQKFQTMVQQIIDLGITTEVRLKGATDIIFEKAISEPSFSAVYANICRYMIDLRAQSETKPDEMVPFKNLLLNRCQKEFEREKADEAEIEKKRTEIQEAPEEKRPELRAAFEEELKKSKQRALGNIRFIGELFKLKILTERIMHDCLFKLLSSSEEDDLECLCGLLKTIGKEIDNERAKQRVDQYFARMDKFVKQKNTSSRVCFMLQDVLELRRNNWVPRREDTGPKTIEQFHRDAEQEMLTKQAELQRASIEVPKQMGRPPAERGAGHMGDTPQQGEDGWQTKPARATRIDPNKMRNTKKLEFTITSSVTMTGECLSLEQIGAELDKLIKQKASNETIFDWVTANVPDNLNDARFARVLVTVICNSAIVVRSDVTTKMELDAKVLKSRCHLLQRYLDHSADKELQALYAAQAVVHAKDHPAGVLRTLFDALYDEDIITEDTFFKWESSVDPAEAAGRGVARTSVTQFFTWLREAEDDEQEQT